MNTTSPEVAETPKSNGKRRQRLIAVSVLLALLLIAYGVWWEIYARHFEDTDDAYVAGNVVQVTPQVSGTVVALSLIHI